MSREKKRFPDFDHTYCPRFEHIYLAKLDYRKWEQVKQFVQIQSYRPLQTFSRTYLAAWIQIKQLTEENKISNQTVHHQSATKFAFMLQDIKKNYKPVKLLKYLLHF